MAVLRRIEHLSLHKDSPHTDVECTYSIVTDDQGRRYLQIAEGFTRTNLA